MELAEKRMRKLHNIDDLKPARRHLRAALTPAEAALWNILQRAKLRGRKFRRQHSIGCYIVDFYCPSEKLAVELDGAAHDGSAQAAHDEMRRRFLESVGLRVLRVENRQVFENPDAVLAWIAAHFRALS
jgi:very-short-patch-repair endonuclease